MIRRERTVRRRERTVILRAVILGFVLALAASGVAYAQGPAYSAQPPTKGALYSDGQTGRYLLGGAWLYRADTSDVGLAQGWWRNVASTSGWSTTTIPNAYNAGDFSQASMNGYVGWYRRDFTLPAGAFASYVAEGQPALDHSLRVGQLPRDRVAERPRDREPRRRVPALGARPDGPAERRQPADRARRQPAHRRRPAARSGRPMVELRRDPARGLPASGADAPTSSRCGSARCMHVRVRRRHSRSRCSSGTSPAPGRRSR